MTPLTRRYIRTSFVFLVAGLMLGAWIVVAQSMGHAPGRSLITAHVHVLLVGFMLMVVMGVATWMFPRPAVADPRYRPGIAEAVYWIVTAATVLRAAADILAALEIASWRSLSAIGGLGQAMGGLLFVVNMWWRVRMPAATSHV
jgi:hypothetical protein